MSPQFELYSHKSGPNGWKVAIVLKALGLEYTPHYLDFQKGEHKAESFTKYNPNGRIPAIVDHKNNDFTLWESNAILKYLVAKYDKEGKFGKISGVEDEAVLDQWLSFQASGQGPYFGQAAWFKLFAPEKIPYAIKRYEDEIARVLGVLESVLEKQEYLVGNKLTIADISFIPWNVFAFGALLGEGKKASDFPKVEAWHNKLMALQYVKDVYAEREAAGK